MMRRRCWRTWWGVFKDEEETVDPEEEILQLVYMVTWVLEEVEVEDVAKVLQERQQEVSL